MSYTTSKARSARGAVVSIGGQSGTSGADTYTPIYELKDVSFNGGQFDKIDVSNFNSGVDKEFILGLRDNGEMSLKGNFIDGDPGQTALGAASDTGLKYNFKVQLQPGQGQSTGGSFVIQGLVLSFLNITMNTSGAMEFDGKVAISGKPVYTPGTASA